MCATRLETHALDRIVDGDGYSLGGVSAFLLKSVTPPGPRHAPVLRVLADEVGQRLDGDLRVARVAHVCRTCNLARQHAVRAFPLSLPTALCLRLCVASIAPAVLSCRFAALIAVRFAGSSIPHRSSFSYTAHHRNVSQRERGQSIGEKRDGNGIEPRPS